MLAVWAELNVVLADEFRDGNVPAMMDPLNVAKRHSPRCRRRWRGITTVAIRRVMKAV